MNDTPRRPSDGGAPISAPMVTLPPIVVDCSHWDGPPVDLTRELKPPVAPIHSLPPLSVEFRAQPSLEIEMRLSGQVSPELVHELAVKLIHALDAEAPELGLQYNADETRSDVGRLWIVLTPTRSTPDDEDVLRKLAERFGRRLSQTQGLTNRVGGPVENVIALRWSAV